MFSKLAAASAALICAGAMGASAATIDFDDIPTGALLTTLTEDGYTFDITYTATNAQRASGVTVFDTTCDGAACNGDTDLVPGAQGENGVEGNVLIIQEAGSNIPDDAATSGEIRLTLVSGPSFFWTGASAIDDTDFGFSGLIDGELILLGGISLDSNGETGSTSFLSPLFNVGDSIVLNYGGSGGIDSLILAAVPLPAAAGFLLIGLGGIGLVARRKRS